MEALKKKFASDPNHYPQFAAKQTARRPKVYELSDSEDDVEENLGPMKQRVSDASSSRSSDAREKPAPSSSSRSTKPLSSTSNISSTSSSISSSSAKPPSNGHPSAPSLFKPATVFPSASSSSSSRPVSHTPTPIYLPTNDHHYRSYNPNPPYRPQHPSMAPPAPRPYALPSGLFGGGSSGSSSSKPTSRRDEFPSEKPAVARQKRDEDGEVFDVGGGPSSREDYEVYSGDADKHMRELLEGALGGTEDAYDEADAKVEGFRANVQLMPHQIQGVAWMKGRESGKKTSGILADDMGLGKTVQTLARIVQGRPTAAHKKAGYRGGTLVVCPLAVMEQWKEEVQKKTQNGLLQVTTHHGPKREGISSRLEKFDVVITTYQVVASEHANYLAKKAVPACSSSEASSSSASDSEDDDDKGKAKKKPTKKKKKPVKRKTAGSVLMALFETKWHRIVLDEAQNIKNRTTKSAKACIDLPGKYRWCLTGTPIQNNVDELYSLFAFLRVRPLDDWDTFREQISKPVKAGRTKYAMKKLQVILKAIMLRRLKTAEINGKRILNLPDRTVEVVTCSFDEDERAFYQALAEKTALTMSKFMKSGTVMSNYTSILTMLLRLRQACDHPVLVSKSFTSDPDALLPVPPSASAAVATKQDTDAADDLADLFGTLGVTLAKCSICSSTIPADAEDQTYCSDGCATLARKAREKSAESGIGGLPPSSSKIREIRKILRDVEARADGEEKTIIFSQFTSMLDIIEPFLKKDGHRFVRYDGSMVDAKRQVSLEKIKNDPNTKVILISFKAGSTGLNLTCANHVILVDLWWNPALEDQAFDRAHRLGQTRNVFIYKLAIEESVEDRILELQEKKRDLAAAALSGEKLKAMNKLGLEDIMSLFRPYTGIGRHDSDDE